MKLKSENQEQPQRLAYDVAGVLTAVPIGRSKLYEEIRDGRLPSYCIGKRRVIDAADLMAWLDHYKRKTADTNHHPI